MFLLFSAKLILFKSDNPHKLTYTVKVHAIYFVALSLLLVNRAIDQETYFSFIDFVTSFRGGILLVCGGISDNKRPGQTNGNFCTRHNDDGQGTEVHHKEQNDKIGPPEIPSVSVQLIKAIRA